MKNELRTKLEQFIQTTGETQNSVARRIGVSDSAISQYLKGSYPSADTLERKIAEFFTLSEKAEIMFRMPEYVDTSISSVVYDTIEYCHANKSLGVVYGDAGVGKTKACEKYITDHSEAVYISLTPMFSGIRAFLKLLARRLRVNENGNGADILLNIREKLEGSNKVLIIDEAQHLSIKAIEEIRSFNDPEKSITRQGIAVVFVGNHELYGKMVGRYESSFAQLFSRISIRRPVLTTSVLVEDIHKLFPELLSKGMDKEINYLHRIARSRWGIRGTVHVFMNSSNNGDVSLRGLQTTAKHMGTDTGIELC